MTGSNRQHLHLVGTMRIIISKCRHQKIQTLASIVLHPAGLDSEGAVLLSPR
jgi:hypothetical protein